MSAQLQETLQQLYERELNFLISYLWDGGIDVELGDELNGIVAEKNFNSSQLSLEVIS
jgi:hypothetical protein